MHAIFTMNRRVAFVAVAACARRLPWSSSSFTRLLRQRTAGKQLALTAGCDAMVTGGAITQPDTHGLHPIGSGGSG